MEQNADAQSQEPPAHDKEAVSRFLMAQVFFAVCCHVVNLQSEQLLINAAVKGSAVRATLATTRSSSAAAVAGLLVNQLGGRLSDSFGRAKLFMVGPFCQIFNAATTMLFPENIQLLVLGRIMRLVGTTLSGTVTSGAVMSDVFSGKDYALMQAKVLSMVGTAVMLMPFVEGFILKYVKDGPRRSFWALVVFATAALVNGRSFRETLPESKRKAWDLKATLSGLNPFGFLMIFTRGTWAAKRLAIIGGLTTAIDGKNLSDLGMTWMREDLKLGVDGIRNYVVAVGVAGLAASSVVQPRLMSKMSPYQFTTLTCSSSALGLALRTRPQLLVFVSSIALLLPGMNGTGSVALQPIMLKELAKAGFGFGETSAHINNLRVFLGAGAALLYGSLYGFFQKRGLNPGNVYGAAGLLGAVLPLLMLLSWFTPKSLRQLELEEAPGD